jgi:hypothetical protein
MMQNTITQCPKPKCVSNDNDIPSATTNNPVILGGGNTLRFAMYIMSQIQGFPQEIPYTEKRTSISDSS